MAPHKLIVTLVSPYQLPQVATLLTFRLFRGARLKNLSEHRNCQGWDISLFSSVRSWQFRVICYTLKNDTAFFSCVLSNSLFTVIQSFGANTFRVTDGAVGKLNARHPYVLLMTIKTYKWQSKQTVHYNFIISTTGSQSALGIR